MTSTLTAAPAAKETLRGAWVPLAALCLAFFVEMVDNTIMVIALPSITRDLGASTAQLQWVTGAYSLVFGSLLLTAGSIADRFGRRRTLVWALGGFGAVSALVWFVHTPGELIAMRALLGVAAAGMAPVTMSLVFRLFQDTAVRMRAINLMVVIGMSSMAIGPLAAGLALEQVSWHWLLFVNTPIAALAVLGVMRGVGADTADELHDAPIDLPAVFFTIAAIGLGCYTLTSGTDFGWLSVRTLACAIGAAVAIAAFVVRERTASHPMIELSLLSHRTVRGAALAQAGASIAQMAMMLLIMMHLQFALGWSPLKAGLGNLPFLFTMLAATPLAENLTARFGHRITCLISGALIAVGLGLLGWGVPHGFAAMIPGIVVMTAGLRVIMTVCAVALIEAAPEDRTTLATALNDVVQEVGASLGTAIEGTLIAVLVTKVLPADAWPAALQLSFFHGERVVYIVVAVIVALVVGYGAATLTDSTATEEH
ncbi:MFS transporter [Corynebacterium vitaeruminis]|uniref:Major facilitator superfamily (MFS) profile domain-containing protein n=1 Tax=Corynebacterium vitaeruminis DSM 20294 TaxID=1224164 RepID=W5XXF5_9CORY|nr:MFS transporter [Corynebacterium vitaeruminis]AHI21647.1 hypothetical protein B843_01255 [Corynebacterium vitaeruminis DSM 20294]